MPRVARDISVVMPIGWAKDAYLPSGAPVPSGLAYDLDAFQEIMDIKAEFPKWTAAEVAKELGTSNIQFVQTAMSGKFGNTVKQAEAYFRKNVPKFAKDDLASVGSEDPERAIALKRHEEGVTKSQDRRSKDMKNEVTPVGGKDEEGGVTIKGIKFTAAEVAKYPRKVLEESAKTGREPWSLHGKDTELPVAVKPVGLVPLPSGEQNEVSYAPRKVKDADREITQADMDSAARGAQMLRMDEAELKDLIRRHESNTMFASQVLAKSAKQMLAAKKRVGLVGDKKKATDAKVVLPIQRSGSAPEDHMARAVAYEISHDRARALDSYRAAASGFRKANDKVNEVKARDGVAACQTKFAHHYDHPGFGRTKVCDSAEQALRTAVERTRAGEFVVLSGNKVLPGRAKDEHEGFKKLEHSLAHEKGVTDPKALAASIGRKKYGNAGMAKKAAAGKDTAPHKFEKMPGNKPNTPCNKCLEYKSHPNHDTAKAKDGEVLPV